MRTTGFRTRRPSRSDRFSWPLYCEGAMNIHLRKRLSSERGTAILETALTLPLLLVVSVGIFEFGRAYQTWQVMTNAAREGARVAVMPSSPTGAAEARVRQY